MRIEQIKNDIDREKFLFDDAKQNLERVREEKSIHYLKQQGDLFIQSEDQLIMKQYQIKKIIIL